jgi:hypothetical protein
MQVPWRSYAWLVVYAVLTTSISVVLLLVNAGLVYALHAGLADRPPSPWSLVPLWQFVMYVLPVVLLFLEWIIWDTLVDFGRRLVVGRKAKDNDFAH